MASDDLQARMVALAVLHAHQHLIPEGGRRLVQARRGREPRLSRERDPPRPGWRATAT